MIVLLYVGRFHSKNKNTDQSYQWPATFPAKLILSNRTEKYASFVTYFPVVTEINRTFVYFDVPDDSPVGISKIYGRWNVITIGIYLFTDPLFSLQSPSSSAVVLKYKPRGIYWPPAQGSSFSHTRLVRALVDVFEKKNRTTNVQVSVYRLTGNPRSYLKPANGN